MPITNGKESPQFEKEAQPSITKEIPIPGQVIEKKEALEAAPEKILRKKKEVLAAPAAVPAKVLKAKKIKEPYAKSQDIKDIEKILQEGLQEFFAQMPQRQKLNFRKKGEEAARRIDDLIKKTKIKIKKIINIIYDWLKLIPNINKFFLEQESKLKADQILKKVRSKKENI